MACFVVPMVEAILVTVVKKAVEKKEQKAGENVTSKKELTWSRKLGWLNNLLWGGVLLLALEHLWHGEIVPWPPFITAMNNPAEIAPMLHEVATVGTSMAVFVTIVWLIMTLIAEQKDKAVLIKEQAKV